MIRYWDYREEYGRERQEILQLVDRVFSSGRLILGDRVSGFESHFASYCGSRYGVGVGSGTDALFLALKALGIGAGDEVITVANTAVPTVAAIRATGATPVFADVEEDTFLMDVRTLEPVLSKRTRCIVPVHLFGQCADMDAILRTADERGIPVVEDCAQATGALYHGRKAGSLGVIGAFSFYPTKVLGGFGDGGMLVTAQEEHYARLRKLRFYGMGSAYNAEEEGYNSRLDEVHAAILDFKLQKLEGAVQQRARIAEQYAAGLAGVGDISLPTVRSGRSHQFYVYTVRTARRDALQQYLADQGIETRINYPVPVHLMGGYAFLGYRAGSLPVTERLAGRMLSLPLYPGMPEDHVAAVIDRVRTYFRYDRGERG